MTLRDEELQLGLLNLSVEQAVPVRECGLHKFLLLKCSETHSERSLPAAEREGTLPDRDKRF